MPMIVERHRTISEASFRDSFLVGRQPVILTGAIDAWPARRRWSLDFFRGLYGERMVTCRVRSAALRVGIVCFLPCSSRWSPYLYKQKSSFYISSNNSFFL